MTEERKTQKVIALNGVGMYDSVSLTSPLAAAGVSFLVGELEPT
jgi:hypothetical protein